MMQGARVLRSLDLGFDRQRQTLFVRGAFADGYSFSVGFPIAHVAVTFDKNLRGAGFASDPVCAGVIDIEGFHQGVAAAMNSRSLRGGAAARKAYENTLSQIVDHGISYASNARDLVCGAVDLWQLVQMAARAGKPLTELPPAVVAEAVKHPWNRQSNPWGYITAESAKVMTREEKRLSGDAALEATKPGSAASIQAMRNAGPNLADWQDKTFGSGVTKAIESTGKAIGSIATRPLTAAADIAKAAVTGQNVLQAIKRQGNLALGDLKTVAPIAQTVASFVPGVGTLASVAIGATQAALKGQSLTEIVKSAGVSAIPGGPLAQQVARAGLNTVQAGLEGKNILRAAADETIKSVASAIPDPNARALVERVALDAAAGKNVITSAERAAVDAAVQAVPAGPARDAVRQLASGDITPTTVLATVARGVVGGQLPSSAIGNAVTEAVKAAPAIGGGAQLLANARNELLEVASNFVTDPAERAALQQRLASPQAGPVSLTSVKDASARRVLEQALSGKSDPASLLTAADPKFIASVVALDPRSHLAELLNAPARVVSRASGITAPVRPVKLVAPPGQSTLSATSHFPAIGARNLAAWRSQHRS